MTWGHMHSKGMCMQMNGWGRNRCRAAHLRYLRETCSVLQASCTVQTSWQLASWRARSKRSGKKVGTSVTLREVEWGSRGKHWRRLKSPHVH